MPLPRLNKPDRAWHDHVPSRNDPDAHSPTLSSFPHYCGAPRNSECDRHCHLPPRGGAAVGPTSQFDPSSGIRSATARAGNELASDGCCLIDTCSTSAASETRKTTRTDHDPWSGGCDAADDCCHDAVGNHKHTENR